ncbi:gamma-glutamyltransferase [Pseudalkalibacillus sp. A8]|uniref:gamma-glutamyltransferase n=1 Tax=Pseudalkalibacillus sp. A8 TaxID=3382641 RepID=UPI0038B506CF
MLKRKLKSVIYIVLASMLLTMPTVAEAHLNPQVDPQPTATGTGGAVATEHPEVSQAAMHILKQGGNAVDAAIAAAAVQGVVRPFSGGIGGGGMMMVYLEEEDKVITIDNREQASQNFGPHAFLDENGDEYPSDVRKSSGAATGVPGTVLAWEEALEEYGTMTLRQVLQPAIVVAQRGFTIDENFVREVTENADRFRLFDSTSDIYLTEDGEVPEAGDTLTNKDLAETYKLIGKYGSDIFYEGEIAEAIIETIKNPPLADDVDTFVLPGDMTMSDLQDYEIFTQEPTNIDYRDYEVYGMSLPSSGGITIGEALNILEGYDLSSMSRTEALHYYLEASRHAFADRDAYLGDPNYTDVPITGLLTKGFAAERRQEIGERASVGTVSPGDPWPYEEDPDRWPDPKPELGYGFNYDFAGENGDAWDQDKLFVETDSDVTFDIEDWNGRIVLGERANASGRATSNMELTTDSELLVPYKINDISPSRYLRYWLRSDGWVRSTSPHNGYGVEIRSGYNNIRLIRTVDGGEIEEIGRFSYPRTTDWQQLRFRVEDDQIKVKTWNQSEAEPADWNLEVQDDGVTDPGRFLLSAIEFRDGEGGSYHTGPIQVEDLTHEEEVTTVPADYEENEDMSQTIHLSVSDKDGNVVSYTNTIVSIGGNGMVVPGYGFLLNDALSGRVPSVTTEGEPNAPEPGMRPLSSMSPTIVMKNGDPVLTLGAPGSATIITTVLQTMVYNLDLGMNLPEALAAPRLTQRNRPTGNTVVEAGFTETEEYEELKALGHTFYTSTLSQGIGAATAIAFLPDGKVQAAAEPVRRGGGSAMVEYPIEE